MGRLQFHTFINFDLLPELIWNEKGKKYSIPSLYKIIFWLASLLMPSMIYFGKVGLWEQLEASVKCNGILLPLHDTRWQFLQQHSLMLL